MERFYRVILLFVISQFLFLPLHAKSSHTYPPIGYWKSVDTKNSHNSRIIYIWQTKDHLLLGKVIKTSPGKRDNQHGNPLNVVILSGVKEIKLIDTGNGNTCRCSLHLAENGKKLNVRGRPYMPLFGGTQVWQRVDLMALN